jgi:hypothetical protein
MANKKPIANYSGELKELQSGDKIAVSDLGDVSATSRVLGRKTAGAGAIEELTIDEILNFLTDNTNNNVSTSKHGLTPKLPNDNTKFLDGQGVFDTVKDSDLVTSDITTNNASSTKHGFCPKLPNNTTTFLRGDGTFATPASGGKFAESKILTSNFSGGSGAITDVTGLSSSIEANKKYFFSIGISVDDQSDSSYFYIDLPSGAVFSGLSYGVTSGSGFTNGTKRMRTTGSFYSFTTGVRFIIFTGILEVGSTAGNFKIQVYNASENVWVGAGSGYSLFET